MFTLKSYTLLCVKILLLRWHTFMNREIATKKSLPPLQSSSTVMVIWVTSKPSTKASKSSKDCTKSLSLILAYTIMLSVKNLQAFEAE